MDAEERAAALVTAKQDEGDRLHMWTVRVGDVAVDWWDTRYSAEEYAHGLRIAIAAAIEQAEREVRAEMVVDITAVIADHNGCPDSKVDCLEAIAVHIRSWSKP